MLLKNKTHNQLTICWYNTILYVNTTKKESRVLTTRLCLLKSNWELSLISYFLSSSINNFKASTATLIATVVS